MAIFQDQPINLEAVKGVSPERFVQRAEREQQAVVGDFLRMQQGIQAGIQEFEQKREEKQNMAASLQLLKELNAVEGLSDESIKAGIKNAGGATNFLKTLGNMQAMEEQSRLRQAQIAQLGRGPTQADIDKAAADLAKTKAETAKTKAETAAMGKPKSLTAAERMRLIETKVGDVTFGQYLQELQKTKKIKGGELHQRGLFNFDEDQIAAFDDVLINYPEFLQGMPQAVQDYYSKASGSPRVITLPDGTQVEVNPQ